MNILCPNRIRCCKFNRFADQPFITNSAPDAPCLGQAYSFMFEASGGTPPYTWSIGLGSLPNGLTLTETGLLEGTPELLGFFIFTVRLTDADGNVRGATYTLDVTECEELGGRAIMEENEEFAIGGEGSGSIMEETE